MLLLDTARFKYPPHWIDIELLYKSICTVADTGMPRGILLLTRKASQHERATLPAAKVRQPILPTINLCEAYRQYL